MDDELPVELDPPDGVDESEAAIEVLRAWIGDGSLLVGVHRQPAAAPSSAAVAGSVAPVLDVGALADDHEVAEQEVRIGRRLLEALRGQRGHLEAYASATSVVKRTEES